MRRPYDKLFYVCEECKRKLSRKVRFAHYSRLFIACDHGQHLCRDCFEVKRFYTNAIYIRDAEKIFGRELSEKPCTLYCRFMRDPYDLSIGEIEQLLASNILGCWDKLNPIRYANKTT